MRTRRLVMLSAFVLALAGCAQGPSGGGPLGDAHDVVVLGTQDGAVVVDAAAGDVLARDQHGIASLDGSMLYSTSRSQGSTTVEARNAVNGEVASSAPFDGSLDVRVASTTGELVAMMRPLPDGLDPWTPVPRSHTEITVADPSGDGDPRTYRLNGNYEPEAFSVDDSRLFLIQYLPAESPTVYRVTVMDLANGHVRNVYGRFKTAPERMPGVRLRQLYDPTTSQLYTLYTNDAPKYPSSYMDPPATGGAVTFVHVLNLADGWAYCAGVPKSMWGEPAEAQAMTTSPDGRLLYIVDSMHGIVAVMNTRSLEIVRTARVNLGVVDGERTSARASEDGRTIYVGSARDGSAVYALDARTLEFRERWPMPGTVLDLGLSADGARLYAATPDRIAVVDAAGGGAELMSLPLDGVDSIVSVASPTT